MTAAEPNPRRCTCHPDDNPPVPCPQKFALTECRLADVESRLHAATGEVGLQQGRVRLLIKEHAAATARADEAERRVAADAFAVAAANSRADRLETELREARNKLEPFACEASKWTYGDEPGLVIHRVIARIDAALSQPATENAARPSPSGDA